MTTLLLKKIIRYAILLLAVALVTFMSVRIYDSQRGPRLEVWHTYVPHELSQAALDKTDWSGYIAAENRVFDEVQSHVIQHVRSDQRVPLNRYFAGSSIYPPGFDR
ncbi:MAG: alpha/beta hydrolase, partial [Enterobacteriaceae bacterium]